MTKSRSEDDRLILFSVATPEGVGRDNDTKHDGEGDLYGCQTSIHCQRELLGGNVIRSPENPASRDQGELSGYQEQCSGAFQTHCPEA